MRTGAWLGVASAILLFGTAHAQEADQPIAPGGTVTVPSYKLPPSVYLSDAARDALPKEPIDVGALLDRVAMSGPEKAAQTRHAAEKAALARSPDLLRKYAVELEETTVAGVRGYWTRPTDKTATDQSKVLLNLPGGGFVMATATRGAIWEAVPLAARAGMNILTIQYRQAPEAVYPAATEDVVAVYRELLKTYKAKNIGIYGCSAGGLLTAQTLAALQREGLPIPAAAGIFCASADARWTGDSWYWQKPIQGLQTAPTLDERFYYADHDLLDPAMSPDRSEAILKRFPPTLLVTATRAGELSAAVNTHRLLTKVGVDADLHIWDGLNHAFYYNEALPESQEAFDVMARFFRRHLGK